jgi:hypothetical protein
MVFSSSLVTERLREAIWLVATRANFLFTSTSRQRLLQDFLRSSTHQLAGIDERVRHGFE